MMIIPFKAVHLAQIIPHSSTIMAPDVGPAQFEQAGPGITGIIDDQVIFCVGRVQMWQGRYQVWAIFSKDAGKHMLRVTRAVRMLIDGFCTGRIEAMVDSQFETGKRWAELLGFRYHHHEERFLPNGNDADIYVRFN